jgi:hypothetical protein
MFIAHRQNLIRIDKLIRTCLWVFEKILGRTLQWVKNPLEASYWHLPIVPFHDFPLKVWDSGEKGYEFRTPDLKKTKPAGTLKGKS